MDGILGQAGTWRYVRLSGVYCIINITTILILQATVVYYGLLISVLEHNTIISVWETISELVHVCREEAF